jgi:hypothetical protein
LKNAQFLQEKTNYSRILQCALQILKYLTNIDRVIGERSKLVILTISLFILGTAFLLLGWRWKNPPSEEVVTALKGVSHLKKELHKIQDQVNVHVFEETLQKTRLMKLADELEGMVRAEAYQDEEEQKETAELYPLRTKDPIDKRKDASVGQQGLSPKYQEVLTMAANGQCIAEIAQHLLLSQDAVRMVLKTQSQGGV